MWHALPSQLSCLVLHVSSLHRHLSSASHDHSLPLTRCANTAQHCSSPTPTAVIHVSERSVTKINKRKESEGIFKQLLFRRDDFHALSLPLLRGGRINSDVWWAIQGQDEQIHFWFMRWLRSGGCWWMALLKSGRNQTSAVKSVHCAIAEFFWGKCAASNKLENNSPLWRVHCKKRKMSCGMRCPWVDATAHTFNSYLAALLTCPTIVLNWWDFKMFGVFFVDVFLSSFRNPVPHTVSHGYRWSSLCLTSRDGKSICILCSSKSTDTCKKI